jgi:hypothetical protein
VQTATPPSTPIQLLERGDGDRLWRMIYEIEANVAN